jgi:hypothetical protein
MLMFSWVESKRENGESWDFGRRGLGLSKWCEVPLGGELGLSMWCKVLHGGELGLSMWCKVPVGSNVASE